MQIVTYIWSIFVPVSMIVQGFWVCHFMTTGFKIAIRKYPSQVADEPRPPIPFKKEIMSGLFKVFLADLFALGLGMYLIYVFCHIDYEVLMVTEIICWAIIVVGFLSTIGFNV